ncbi:MAG: hypothetical protein OQK69_13055, partial [Gammaproteobacteria bacterium]|nr:hypothetical protein [Gammaproteobacteria bacterium]
LFRSNLYDAVYVISLSLICTFPIIFATSYRGKHSLILLFLAFYFGVFGIKDIASFVANEPISIYETNSLFSSGEIAILAGAICFILGYAIVSKLYSEHRKGILTKDWSHKHMGIVGICFWLIGIYIETSLRLTILDMAANIGTTHATGFLILLRYLQPLGSLILIYMVLTTRNKTMLGLLIFTMLMDFAVGFIGDSKVIALRAPILYLFSFVLLREKLPLVKTVVFVIIAGLMFNIFNSYRTSLHLTKETRIESYENIGAKLEKFADSDQSTGERFTEGINYFADRITLKNYVEFLMTRVGEDTKFLHGETIEPIIYAFIPRFIMPDKPATNILGQLFNNTFSLSQSSLTFIALSQVGELYWNYSWPGIIFGMMIIGAFMSLIAATLRLDKKQTLPRFLLLLMTVYLLIIGFETAIAQSYTLWARFFILLILINLLIPKQKGQNQKNKTNNSINHKIQNNNLNKRIIAFKKN